MPDTGLDDVFRLDFFRDVYCPMRIRMATTPPPAPELKNKRELISRGRKGIVRITEKKPWSVKICPPRWKRQLWTGRIEDHQAAQFVDDVAFHDVGRPPVHFPEAAGFTNHQVEATDTMFVQDLLAHVQPDQVEEASFDGSLPRARSLGEGSLDPWKKPRRSLYHEDVQIADSCDVYSFGMTCSKINTGRLPYETIDREFPHSIPEHEVKQRVKHPVAADLPSSTDYLEKSGDEPDSESEAMDVPTDEEVLSGESGASVESHTEIASVDSHGPRTEPSRKRSAASTFYDDNLFAQIRSYVNQQIEEALLPLISALRSREEDEHKHRQKMLALEQEKLALMRQKLECTRRSNLVPVSICKIV